MIVYNQKNNDKEKIQFNRQKNNTVVVMFMDTGQVNK
jgi:hypothetical protein